MHHLDNIQILIRNVFRILEILNATNILVYRLVLDSSKFFLMFRFLYYIIHLLFSFSNHWTRFSYLAISIVTKMKHFCSQLFRIIVILFKIWDFFMRPSSDVFDNPFLDLTHPFS